MKQEEKLLRAIGGADERLIEDHGMAGAAAVMHLYLCRPH